MKLIILIVSLFLSHVYCNNLTDDDDSFHRFDDQVYKVAGLEEIYRKPNWFADVTELIVGIIDRASGKDYKLDVDKKSYKEYDYIVVGAGSAGSVVASRLAELSDVTVLVLEEGGEESKFSTCPGSYFLVQGSDRIKKYESVPQKYGARGMKNHAITTWVGRGVGGGSGHNSAIYNRGSKLAYDRWEDVFGASGWSYKKVFPYFLKSEGVSKQGSSYFDKDYHSNDGPLTVEGRRGPSIVGRTFWEAVKEMGLPLGDYNGKDQARFTYAQFNLRNGERISTGKAFLGPASKSTNMDVITYAYVNKVLLDDSKRAYGVLYEKNGQLYQVNARKEIIISAGAYGSPKLLMLSGIGPEAELKRHNIPVRVDLPGVGQNFQYHPYTEMIFSSNINTTMVYTRPAPYFDALNQYIDNRTGPFSQFSFDVIGHIRSSVATDERPDIYIAQHPSSSILSQSGLLIGNLYGLSSDLVEKYFTPNAFKDGFTVAIAAYVISKPGEVRLRSRNPKDDPIIDHKIFSDERDARRLVDGCKLVDKLIHSRPMQEQLNAKPFKNTIPGCTQYPYGTDDYFNCFVRTITWDTWHPCCTCKMGPSKDPMAVVDPDLRVYGVKNLRIIDASIMPEISNSNTNAPSIMIGEKGADIMKNVYLKPVN